MSRLKLIASKYFADSIAIAINHIHIITITDYDYNYYVKDEGDKEYEKNWSRSKWINTDNWDGWYSLEQRYLDAERENNKKKFKKPKLIINNK